MIERVARYMLTGFGPLYWMIIGWLVRSVVDNTVQADWEGLMWPILSAMAFTAWRAMSYLRP